MRIVAFVCALFCALHANARTCYECYDKAHCEFPSITACPSDEYGCATAILDIEPYITKGCLSDDNGPLKLDGCKRKTRNSVSGQLCGCMNKDLCNTECNQDGDCSLESNKTNVEYIASPTETSFRVEREPDVANQSRSVETRLRSSTVLAMSDSSKTRAASQDVLTSRTSTMTPRSSTDKISHSRMLLLTPALWLLRSKLMD